MHLTSHIFLATLFCASTYFHLCSSSGVIFDETSKRENVVIDCRDSTSCLVKCSQPDTCRGFTVRCGRGTCTIEASNARSLLDSVIDCGSAATCKILCKNPQTCKNLKVQNCRGQCTVEATNDYALNGANIDCRDRASSRCSSNVRIFTLANS